MFPDLTPENYISIVAVITGIVSLYYSNRALKQSEENVRQQLVYNDQIKAFKTLHDIIGGKKNYGKIKGELESFLNSFEGQFLPKKTASFIYDQLREMDAYLYKNDPTQMPEPSDKEREEMEYEDYVIEQEQRKHMEPWEQFEEEFSAKMDGFKGSLKGHIAKNVKKNI